MKNLLKLVALVVLFTSCSVDQIDNDQSFESTDLTKSITEQQDPCLSYPIVNADLIELGTMNIYANSETDQLIVEIKVVKYKIRESLLYFGMDTFTLESDPNANNPFENTFVETWKDNIYTVRYEFALSDVEKNTILASKLLISSTSTNHLVVKPLTDVTQGNWGVIDLLDAVCGKF